METTEPADEGISTLEPPSAFEEMKRNLPESSSPGNSRNNDQRILMESPRRRRIKASARVPFLGTLPEEEWEVHHRDHESRTGCKLDRVAFMEEVWTVIQSYGTQSILKTGLNQPLMREVLDKLDECEGRPSELLIDSATDESEANSPIKMTPQDDGEVVYLSRTRRGTMRSKMVIDKINAMKMKLGSRVMPRRIGKTKVDSEISMKAGNSAKRKRVEEVMDLGQGDYQLSGTDRLLTDIAMVPPILMAGIKSTGYKSKRSDRTLTGATLEMEILSQCGESKMRDFKPSPMNHGKGSVAGQLTPVEYNRLTVSETVSIDEPTGGYMEMLAAALPPAVSQIPGKHLCFLVTRATEKQHVDPENLVLSLTRLRDFLVEMDVKELSLPVYDPNRGRLHPRELYALVHVIFSDTNIQVYLHKKYYLSIG